MELNETPPPHSLKSSRIKWAVSWLLFLGAPATTVLILTQKKDEMNGLLGLLYVQPASSICSAWLLASFRFNGLRRILVCLVLTPVLYIAETAIAYAGCLLAFH